MSGAAGVVWGLLTALSIGGADLFGRRVVHASSTLRTATTMQAVGALLGVACLAIVSSRATGRDLALAAVSGVGWAIGLTCYYEGLRRGSSVVVAPIVAVLSSALPYLYAVASGTVPSALAVGGAGLAVLGLVLVTGRRPGGRAPVDAASVRGATTWAVRSGLGYGAGFIVAIEIAAESGAWPVVAQRTAATMVLIGVAVATRQSFLPPLRLAPAAATAGVMVGLSTLFYLFGVQRDAPSTVVVSNLFPVFTVAVGFFLFDDRIVRTQLAGFALSLLGVLAIVAG